jgi:uroporphyrinogen decarboxylase
MSSFERVKAAFRKQRPDRVPFYPIVSALAGSLIGIDAKTYYTDLDRMADAHIALHEDIRQDVVALMADLFIEVEAMGAEVDFVKDDVPRLRSYLLKDDKTRLGSLRVPDPSSTGRMPAYLEACKKVSGAITQTPVGGVICGPWTLATNMRGAENLIMDTATHPEFVHELMRFTVEVVKSFGEAVNKAGAGLSLSEAPASLSLISPKIFRAFVMPYLKDLIAHLRERKTSVTLHICGVIEPIMEDIASVGAIALSMDEPSSLEKMFEASEGRMVVIGNVATNTFVDGTPEDMEREVKRCMDQAKEKPGFILASGCEISPRADMDKIRHFCALALELGTLD